jgi:hypothetical protein
MVDSFSQTLFVYLCYSLWNSANIVESFLVDNKGCCAKRLLRSHLTNDQPIRARPPRQLLATDPSDRTQVCTYRRATINLLSLWTAVFPFIRPCFGFEGGIGGLGKTKPQTGAILWDPESTPFQSDTGTVSAELNVANRAVLVSFQSPWPLTGAVETRNIGTGESAFVQVVEATSARNNPKNGKEAMKQLLLDSVLAQQGKFGAYGSLFDIKITGYELYTENGKLVSIRCTLSFTTLTPGLRESERQAVIKAVDALNDKTHWVLLVAGMTRQGFSKQERTFAKVVDSFQVVPAPPSSLVRKTQV